MSSSNKKHPFSADEMDTLGVWDFSEQFGSGNRGSALQHKGLTSNSASMTVEDVENMQQQAYDEAFSQGHEEGYKKGFEEGMQQGREQGAKEGFEQGMADGSKKGYDENIHLLRKQAAEFVSLLESLAEPFQELDEAVETELVNLAIGIANQLVRREIKINPGQIIAVIREAINILPLASQKLTLQLHPNDAELVRSSLALDDISPVWHIVEDPLITRGGCKVLTETSFIDATVEKRLAAIVVNVLGGERKEDERQ